MPEISQNPEAEFELRREALAERLKLKDQWSGQVKILGEVGLLTILPDKHDYGIVGIDGEEYPIPTYGEILKKITPEKLEMLASSPLAFLSKPLSIVTKNFFLIKAKKANSLPPTGPS